MKVGDNLQRGQGCFVLVKDSWCHGQKFFDAKMCFFIFANPTFLGVWGIFLNFKSDGAKGALYLLETLGPVMETKFFDAKRCFFSFTNLALPAWCVRGKF